MCPLPPLPRHGHGRNAFAEPLHATLDAHSTPGRSRSMNSHEHPNYYAAGGLRTPTGSNKNIDQSSRHSARSCRYGSACRGQFSYCRYANPVVVDPALSDWSVVVRRRRSPRIRGAVVNEVVHDDAVVDNLVDIDIANHYGQFSEFSAPDAMHDNFDNAFLAPESELSSPYNTGLSSPAGSGMSLSLDGLELNSHSDLSYDGSEPDHDSFHDNAYAQSVNGFYGTSYAGEAISHVTKAMTRVTGCVSLLPFSMHSHKQTGHSTSFCKDVERFQFEMDELNPMLRSTKSYRDSHNNRHKIPYRKTTLQILEDYNDDETHRMESVNKALRAAIWLAKELKNTINLH